jgi:pectate lyase
MLVAVEGNRTTESQFLFWGRELENKLYLILLIIVLLPMEVLSLLSGRVMSSKNKPVENVIIKLQSLGTQTITDENGEFNLATSAVRRQTERSIGGNIIRLLINENAPLVIDVVNLQGKTVYSQRYSVKESGNRHLNVFPSYIKPGIYVVKLTSGIFNNSLKIVHHGRSIWLSVVTEKNKRIYSLTAAGPSIDTLELRSETHLIGMIPVNVSDGRITDITIVRQVLTGVISTSTIAVDSVAAFMIDSNDHPGVPFKLSYNLQTNIFSELTPWHVYDQHMERAARVIIYGNGKILNITSSKPFTDSADTVTFDSIALDGSETVTLPSEQKFGGGDTVGSVLIGKSYTAGNGPGIYAVGNGGFRLYYNGELIATQTVAGKVTFVPLTFLPGKNVIAVAGVNGFGTPGVLVHIDELERSYVSGSEWKVNATPENNGWKSMSFNDASWASATVSGNASTSPGGMTISGFASGSTAKWIWSNNTADSKAVLRYTFNISPIGFGAAATGGMGGPVVVATTVAQIEQYLKDTITRTILVPEGTYDFRANHSSPYNWCTCQCNSTDLNPGNIYYRVTFDGTCGNGETVLSTVTLNDKWITCRANKSLIGMGRGANLRGSAITVRGNENGSNCIFRNLAIFDINPKYVEAGDGITPVTTSNIWVDHCSFKWVSDGNDLESTTGATFSYVYYDGNNHLNCYRQDPYAALVLDTKVTYHHCYWVDCSGRVPKVHASSTSALPTSCHLFNNVIDNCTFFSIGCSGTNSLGKAAEVVTEFNYFKNVNALTYREENGKVNFTTTNVASGGNRYHWDATRTNVARPADAVFSPSSAYSYTPETDVSSLVTTVPLISGKGGKWVSGSGVPEY